MKMIGLFLVFTMSFSVLSRDIESASSDKIIEVVRNERNDIVLTLKNGESVIGKPLVVTEKTLLNLIQDIKTVEKRYAYSSNIIGTLGLAPFIYTVYSYIKTKTISWKMLGGVAVVAVVVSILKNRQDKNGEDITSLVEDIINDNDVEISEDDFNAIWEVVSTVKS